MDVMRFINLLATIFDALKCFGLHSLHHTFLTTNHPQCPSMSYFVFACFAQQKKMAAPSARQTHFSLVGPSSAKRKSWPGKAGSILPLLPPQTMRPTTVNARGLLIGSTQTMSSRDISLGVSCLSGDVQDKAAVALPARAAQPDII